MSLKLPGFPGGSDVKESACNSEDLCSISGLGRSPGEGNGNPLQYSCLEFHGQRSPAGYTPWDRIDPDMTERLSLSHSKALVSFEGESFSEVSFSYKECLAMCSNVSKK